MHERRMSTAYCISPRLIDVLDRAATKTDRCWGWNLLTDRLHSQHESGGAGWGLLVLFYGSAHDTNKTNHLPPPVTCASKIFQSQIVNLRGT